MNKQRLLVAFIGVVFFFGYGLVVGKYEVFPYKYIKNIKNKVVPTGRYRVVRDGRNGEELIRIFEHFNPKADVAFVGDSITFGGKWSEFFPSVRTVNRGVGADEASDILLRLDSIISSQPTKVFIMVGINDIHQSVSVDKILNDYRGIVKSLEDANTKVYVQSTIQCAVNVCGWKKVAAVSALNKGLKHLTQDNGYVFVDLGALSNEDGLESKFTYDGTHLTVDGYIYWVEKIQPYVLNET